MPAGVHRPGYTERYLAMLRQSRLDSKPSRGCLCCATPISASMNRNAKYCSASCGDAYRGGRLRATGARKPKDRPCEWKWGAKGEHLIPDSKKAGARFCSDKCSAAFYEKGHRKRLNERRVFLYHTDPRRPLANAMWSVANRGRRQAWRHSNRERLSEYFRGRREALAGLPPYPRMDPWPTDCQVCGEAIDLTLVYPNPLAETDGHEPPIRWAAKHPDYDGCYVLRPEHSRCNKRKGARPDWEIREQLKRRVE